MQIRKSRFAGAAATFAAAALLLSACSGGGGGGSDAPASGENGSGGGDAAASGEVTEIEFWHRTFTPVENDWYKGIVEQFNEAQSEVHVNVTEVPADAWDQRMKAAQAAGSAPDVYTHSASIPEAVEAGQLHPLNDIISEQALSEIIDSALPVSEIDGTFYAYPLLQEPQSVLFWNKNMLEAAGLDPETGPTTWDELFEMCEQIKPTLAGGQFCISPAGDAGTFAWSTVGQQYNFSGHTALNDTWTEPTINDEGYIALMESYKTLWDNDYMPKQILAPYVEGSDFGQEKAAFKVSGSWMMSEIGSDYPDLLDRTGIGAFPNAANADGRSATTMGNFKWVVDARTEKPEASGKFVEWALGGDPQLLVPFFVETQFTKVPSRMAVQDAVAEAAVDANAPWSAVIMDDIAPTAIAEPTYPWDVSLAVGTMMESVMKGAESTESAIATAENAIQLVIDREDLPAQAPGAGN